MKNLAKRNGTFYMVKTVSGRRFMESLGTKDAKVARERLRVKLSALNDPRYPDADTALQSTRIRSNYPTVGGLLAKYMEVVTVLGRPIEGTARRNAAALRLVVREGLGCENADAQSIGALDGALVQNYGAAKINPAAGGQVAESARRSVVSTLLQARSVFKPSCRQAYADSKMPLPYTLDAFLTRVVCHADPVEWKPPADDELKPVLIGAELLNVCPALYQVWLLAYYLGLRSSEMVALRWTWFEERDARLWVHVCDRPAEGYSPKGSSGWTPVAPDVFGALQRAQTESVYVLPGSTRTQRQDLVGRQFAGWMRRRGWKRRETAHELRKIRGNIWAAEYGIDVASAWLRHSGTGVTRRHYRDAENYVSRAPAIGMEG